MNYSDSEINEFLALAQEIGITKARRDLGYPKSWATGKRWAELRGIEIPLDDLKAQAAATREWYKDEEVKIIAQEGFNRVYDELVNNRELTPTDQKRLSEAATKYYAMWAAVQGKATIITENRRTDSMDEHLEELLNVERAKNLFKKENIAQENNDVA